MRVVEQKDTATQVGNYLFDLGAVEAAARRAFETVEQAGLVALGLQAANEPGAHVRERFIVQINRVLRGEDHAHAESACLLEQSQHGGLRRWIASGWKIPINFIHVDDSA